MQNEKTYGDIADTMYLYLSRGFLLDTSKYAKTVIGYVKHTFHLEYERDG